MNEQENKQDQINNTPENGQLNNNVNVENTNDNVEVINANDSQNNNVEVINTNNSQNSNVEVINANNNTQPEVLDVSPQPQTTVQPEKNVVAPPSQKPTLNKEVENKKEVEPEPVVEDQPLTFKKKVQYFFVGILFILLAAFIYFLPEINEYISTEGFKEKEKVITTGTLTCKMNRKEGSITYQTTDEFEFTEELLKSYKRTAQVSTNEDDDGFIANTQTECENLKEQTSELSGIDVTCNSNSTFQRTVQKIDYEEVNTDKAKAAFAEVGGTYPQYSLDKKISEIEQTMEESGFECNRTGK